MTRPRYSALFDAGRWLVVEDTQSRREVVKWCGEDRTLAQRWAAWFNDPESGLHNIPPQPQHRST